MSTVETSPGKPLCPRSSFVLPERRDGALFARDGGNITSQRISPARTNGALSFLLVGLYPLSPRFRVSHLILRIHRENPVLAERVPVKLFSACIHVNFRLQRQPQPLALLLQLHRSIVQRLMFLG